MTKNQIDYWRLQEEMRSNRTNEAETNRSNVARESENYRHNTATETETGRSNRANEQYQLSALSETRRHNQVGEQQNLLSINETTRSNKANEALKSEANKYQYYNAQTNARMADIAAKNANTQAKDAETRRIQASESARHNKSTEATDRAKIYSGIAGKAADVATTLITKRFKGGRR